MMRFVWVILFIGFTSFQAQAQWRPEIRAKLLSLNSKYSDLGHMGLATFWGGWRRASTFTLNDGETVVWNTPLFKRGKLPIYLSHRETPSPLVIFMPGIFGSTDKGLSPMMIDRFEKAGAHVLVVPNLVSTQYVSASPLYQGDIVDSEVQVMEGALDFALKNLNSKVTAVHVVAESLGTIVGSAWTAWDTTHNKRISSLTLLSPPMDLSMAMKNFDDVISEYRTTMNDCSELSLMWTFFTQFLLREIPSELTIQEKRCLAGRVLVNAFLKAAQKSYEAHSEVMKLNNHLQVSSFETFFKEYRPEFWNLIENKDEKLKLKTWIKLIHQNSSIPLRLLTSKDDFLNRGLSWSQFLEETKLPNDDLVILDWGGHSGALGTVEMDSILGDLSVQPEALKTSSVTK